MQMLPPNWESEVVSRVLEVRVDKVSECLDSVDIVDIPYLIYYNPVSNTMHQSQIYVNILHHKINVTGHLLLSFVPI